MKRAGLWLLAAAVLVTIAAPWLAPNPPDRRHPGSLYAPPTTPHLFDGAPRAPFIYPQRLGHCSCSAPTASAATRFRASSTVLAPRSDWR